MDLPAPRGADHQRRGLRRHGHASRGPGLSRLSVVIVTFESRAAIEGTLAGLRDELHEDDELIVVDNASADGTPEVVRATTPQAVVIETGANLGFAAGCNVGAEAASGELLVLLNPDATPQPGFREAIVAPHDEARGWAAWMGLVTQDGGRRVNTRGGVVHFTGIAWAGGAGDPLDERRLEPAEVGFASGACLAIPLRRWRQVGGFPPRFFLYEEDVDLALRLRLEGGRIGIEPAARVDHDYEFAKGEAKWRHLERNRWAMIVRTYPIALLAAVAPALLATELALVVVSVAGGWARQKALAWVDVVRWLPALLRERREIQSRRSIAAGEFARHLRPELESVHLGRAARSPALRAALRAYWSVVLALLGARS